MTHKNIQLTAIAAVGLRGELSYETKLPWHQPADLKFFAEQTRKSIIIMGRKTFECFPKKLPGRHHCVISKNFQLNNDVDVTHLKDIENIWSWPKLEEDGHAFVIGGGQIYSQLIPFCQKVLITHIHGIFKADTFLDLNLLRDFNLERSVYHPADSRHKHSMTFATYTQ